jgi:outer membrane protein assembly factor BamB
MDVSRRQFVATMAAGLVGWPLGSQARGMHWWSQFKGDAQRTGRSRFAAPVTHDVVWSVPFPSMQSELSVDADGVVYCGGNSNFLYAVDPPGKQRWKHFIGHTYVAGGTAVLPDGAVVMVGTNGVVRCYEADRTPRWKTSVHGICVSVSAPLVASDGMIYIGRHNSGFYALRPDGSRAWRRDLLISGPAAEGLDGTIYVPSEQDLVALSPQGKELWRCRTTSDIYGLQSAPAVGDDGVIYVGGSRGELFAVDPDGQLRWHGGTLDIGGNSFGRSPALAPDGTLYFCTPYRYLNAVDPATGKFLWRYELPGQTEYFTGASVTADGTVLVSGPRGQLFAFSPAGETLWVQDVTLGLIVGSPVPMKNGQVLVGTTEGLVIVG